MTRVQGPSETDAAMARAAELAREFVHTLAARPVHATSSLATLRERFGGPLPDEGEDPVHVIEALAANADGGIIASAGPRYFGFVIGGGLPAAVGADWLTSAWDQNAGLYVIGPAAAVAEEVAGAWMAELFGLPPTSAWGSPPGPRWPRSPASRRVAMRCSPDRAGTSSDGACSVHRRSPSS